MRVIKSEHIVDAYIEVRDYVGTLYIGLSNGNTIKINRNITYLPSIRESMDTSCKSIPVRNARKGDPQFYILDKNCHNTHMVDKYGRLRELKELYEIVGKIVSREDIILEHE